MVDELKCTEMVLMRNGADSEHNIGEESEPRMATFKSNHEDDEPVLQARDTNMSNQFNHK